MARASGDEQAFHSGTRCNNVLGKFVPSLRGFRSLGDLGVTPIVAAPILAALFIFALGVGLRAPAFLDAAAKRKSSSAPRRQLFAFDDQSGRLDLALVGSGDFTARATAARNASAGMAKRCIDVLGALSLLMLTAPLLLLTAIAIKLESPGPVLYRQERVGICGRRFAILKFRSMVADAEKDGARWAAKNDDRVTRVGRIIRKARIDEIPQAINVLRGEMSIVGPRPERPEFVAVLEKEIPNYHLRHIVRPGITGWAQVKYVYGASIDDARVKLQYDLHYIRNFRLWRDVLIMLMTVRVALFGLGSR